MTTPRLGAPELVSGQATPETTVNEQVRYLEAGSGHFIFKDRDLATPPGSPADGDCYLVAASPTGAWAGQAGKITVRVNTAWAFITVIEGFTAWVNDENVLIGYDGSAWSTLSAPSGSYQPLDSDLTAIAGLTPSQGDVLYHNGTQWTRLAAGTSGQFLKTNGAGANPAWAASGGASTSQTGEQISGFIASPSNKSYTIALDMKHAGTITEVTTKSASGTCTATWKINTTALGGTANSVSSTETTQTHASSNAFSAGDDIVLTVSSNSSCADMSFTIKYTRTLA